MSRQRIEKTIVARILLKLVLSIAKGNSNYVSKFQLSSSNSLGDMPFFAKKIEHPSPDNPQKKNQNHHLGDPKIYQVDDVGYPKKQVAKSLQGTFFNKINLKTL